MQTALVAGGAGFIGSHLCASLLADGFRVIALDNLISGEEKNIEELKSNPNFSFINKNVTEPFDLSEKIDFVFHLASPASPNAKSSRSYMAFPVETLLANSYGTYNLLELARKNNAKFIFTSSSETYGEPSVSPQVETYWGNVNPNGPRSVYDEGKRFGEAITMAYVRKFNLDARIVRLFNTYGPKMRSDDGRVVTNFITQALNNEPLTVYGDGKQTRSFCYVDDTVEGIKRATISENTKGEVINLGNPDERTILEFGEVIKRLTNSASQFEFEDFPTDDPHRRNPDITKARKLLSWEPKINLEEGLQKTIDYFKSLS